MTGKESAIMERQRYEKNIFVLEKASTVEMQKYPGVTYYFVSEQEMRTHKKSPSAPEKVMSYIN